MHEIKSDCEFNYSLVSDCIADSLKSKADELSGIYFRYTNEVGKVLFEAQQELSDYNNGGLFAKWVESMGIKRQRAYEYINIYKYVVRITDNEKLEIFNTQPKSIKNEMSKPSAIPEINEAVFNGNVKNHNEYKKMEQEYKKQLKQKDDEINHLKNQPQPLPVVKTVEVKPSDYDSLKAQVKSREMEVNRLSEQLREIRTQREEVDIKSKKYDELTQTIAEMEGKMNDTQKLIQQQKQVYELVDLSKDLLVKITPIPFLIDPEFIKRNHVAERELKRVSAQTEKFLSNLNEVLSELNIIEGEIINE